MPTALKSIRFGASWSTQLRFTQAIGKRLGELMPIEATISIGRPGYAELASGAVDVCFTKSVNNQHRYTGAGVLAGKEPASWLRTIAWLPQEDRFLFAVAPHTGITSFEEIATRKPALHVGGRAAEEVLRAYGFTYTDMESWGGSAVPMEHTAAEAAERARAGRLDALFGDGSAYDFSAWTWAAAQGYRFLDVGEAQMATMEAQGLRRTITPAGYLPGITSPLRALDDSDIVLSCNASLDDELAYNLARALNEGKREVETASIQVSYGQDPVLPLVRPTYWSSLTGPIERQWDVGVTGAPLHPGAERYYREKGYIA
ncbi:MAG: TAXI family TRAP transporter solute-binding subunit [Chloroflexota bacterium]